MVLDAGETLGTSAGGKDARGTSAGGTSAGRAASSVEARRGPRPTQGGDRAAPAPAGDLAPTVAPARAGDLAPAPAGDLAPTPTAAPGRRGAAFSPRIVAGLVAMADGALLFGSGLAIYLLYVGWGGERLPIYLSFLTLNTALVLSAFYAARLYRFEALTRPARQLGRIAMLCAAAFMTMAALAFALKISAELSRLWAFSWYLAATLLIVLARAAFHALLRRGARAGLLTRNVAIVGAGEQGRRLIELLGRGEDPWLRVVGLFDDRAAAGGAEGAEGPGPRAPREIAGIAVRGDVDELVRYARQERVDEILVALPWAAEARLLSILDKLKVLPVHLRLSPDLIGLAFARHGHAEVGGVAALKVAEKPLADWSLVLKALEDRVLAAAILVLVLPLMALVALAVKLDSRGPVLFRQRRYGFNNQLIEVYKFRTMRDDQRDDDAERLATRGDPRITRVGAFLRRTSLDELPQFLNVLKGEMSIVGPRPHARAAKAGASLYPDVVAEYALRHKVKPGITGWAQVNGWRGETDTEEKIRRRVEHDLYYIENWSISFDLGIIIRTLGIVLRNDGIY